MKKKPLLVTILLLLIAVFAFSLTACNNEVGTLESLQNEYGIVVDGGSFEEGSTLVSNEILATTEEAAEVLAAIADQNYNKDGSVYIFDIYVTKDGKEVQPDGKVKVSVPVPNAEVDNYLVFHVKSDNSVENLVPTVADGKISFETSSFSYFVIAEAVIQDAPPIHVHNFEWVEGKESTCKEEGIAPHYHCDGCGKNFDQNYGEIDSVITEKVSHDVGLNYSPRMEPTFFDEGTVAYYICNDCLQYISEDGQIIPPTDIFIPPLSLDISVCVNGVPTELALQGDFNGDTAEWKAEGLSVKIGDVITVCLTDDPSYKFTFTCDGIVDENGVVTAACEVATVDFYADRSSLRLVMIDPTVCEHNYVWTEGKEPTCEEEGVVGHFHCDGCGKNFDQNYGEMESISIQKAEHEYGSLYWGNSANFWEDGNIEYYQCSECEKYFDNEYNEVETPVIPKYSTNISICVNGTPTALVLGEQHENFIEWSLEGLSVTKGDVITICQTDNVEFSHNYFAEGNVGTDGKIITTAAAANVLLTATPNGLMLFIDGYKYEGIVIEINGVQYPMSNVAYPDETKTYIYGYANLAQGDKVVIVDNVSGTIYDYDDIENTYLWDTWDFHRGENGELVIDYACRYGIEFDYDGCKKIFINKVFAPLDGGSYELSFENADSVELSQMEIPKNSEAYKDLMWYMSNEAIVSNEDIVSYVEENGLYIYTIKLELEEGTRLNVKNLTANSIINAEHLVEVYAQNECITKNGDYIEILKSGYYNIVYMPCYNGFMIEEMEPPADVYMLLNGEFVSLYKNEQGVVTYEGLVAEVNTRFMLLDSTYTTYFPVIIDEQADASIAHIFENSGIYMLFFDKAGTYNLAYNIDTHVLSITSVGGDTDQGGDNEQGGNESIDDYIIFISVVDYTNGNQTLYPTKNPDNANEVYIRVETIAANSYLSVSAMSKADQTSTTYGTLADTDASIATNLTADMICVKVAGPIEVYFNFEAKTVKIVAVSGSTEETVLPKDIYISTMETYAFIENPDNSDELCYLGLALEGYDDFRIRDTDNNYISDITLASSTTGANTSGSSVMVEADGIYNIYINKTTHEVRIVAVS